MNVSVREAAEPRLNESQDEAIDLLLLTELVRPYQLYDVD